MSNNIKIDFPKIRRIAKERGLTGSRIAMKAGVSKATVHFIFRGSVDPKAVNLKAVCDAIGLPIEEAFVKKAA